MANNITKVNLVQENETISQKNIELQAEIKFLKERMGDKEKTIGSLEEKTKNTKTVKEVIPKKLAALECFKRSKINMFIGGSLIISNFITVLVTMLSKGAGTIPVAIFAAAGGFVIIKARADMNYLNSQYNLNMIKAPVVNNENKDM